MPPAIFVAAVRAYHTGGIFNCQFDVPVATKPGDVMIALHAGDGDDGSNHLDVGNSPQDWTELGRTTLAQANFFAGGRVAKEDDPATIEMYSNGAFTWEEAILVVYRNVDLVVVDGCSAVNVAASTNFPSPARTLTRYSDLYIGFTAVKADVGITTPVGTTKRLEIVGSAAGRRFCAFDYLQEAPGATGVKTATTFGAQSGCAASLAIAASGLLGGKSLTGVSPVPGMLGLPTKGV